MNGFSFIVSFDLKGHVALKKTTKIANIFQSAKNMLKSLRLFSKRCSNIILSLQLLRIRPLMGGRLMHRQGSKVSNFILETSLENSNEIDAFKVLKEIHFQK